MITDHRDGSWTVTGFKDKKYLTQYLKKEGHRPHVHRKGENRWTIALTKELAYRPKVRIQKGHRLTHRQVSMRYQPRRSVSQGIPITGRYVPLGRMRRYPRGYRRPSYSGGLYRTSPGIRIPGSYNGKGKTIFQRAMEARKARQEKEKQWKEQERILNEKLKQDRIQQERQQVVQQLEKQTRTRELLEKQRQFEQEQERHRQMQQTKQTRHAEYQSQRAQNVQVEKAFKPAVEGLERERENSVIGG